MLKRLILIGIAVVYFNPATAEIKILSKTKLTADGLIAVYSLCVEGYVFHVSAISAAAASTQLQVLNANGKPLPCKGKQHPDVIDKDPLGILE